MWPQHYFRNWLKSLYCKDAVAVAICVGKYRHSAIWYPKILLVKEVWSCQQQQTDCLLTSALKLCIVLKGPILFIEMLWEDAHFSWCQKLKCFPACSGPQASCSPTWSWCVGFQGINILCCQPIPASAEPLAFHPRVIVGLSLALQLHVLWCP